MLADPVTLSLWVSVLLNDEITVKLCVVLTFPINLFFNLKYTRERRYHHRVLILLTASQSAFGSLSLLEKR